MYKEASFQLFQEIRNDFPRLRMQVTQDNPNVDVSMRIPVQDDLPFAVNLYLDGDALHMTAGEKFWLEWFPCDNPEIFKSYREAALGVLSGQYRIVEHYRGKGAVMAQLQRPRGEQWETIGTSGCALFWMPWRRKTTKVLQAPRA